MVTSLGSLAVWQKSQRSIIFGLLIASRKGFEVVFCLHLVQHGANLPSYKANQRKTIVNSWVCCLENNQLVITSGFATVNFRK